MPELVLVDSHCHVDCLDLSLFNNNLDACLQQANELGVKHFLCVCIDLAQFPAMLALVRNYPAILASVGVHPTLPPEQEVTVEQLVALGNDEKIVAIGETGLDYYHTRCDKSVQQQRFRNHIHAAKALKKPLIIHTRAAREDTLAILQQEQAHKVGGVMHCFTETWEMAQQALDLGFYISFSGIITFKNAVALQEIAKKVPLDRLLIETDAPYLAPVPYRGKANFPGYVRYVAEKIAELRQQSLAEIALATTQNYQRCFKTSVASKAD